jgi:transcriptional regulator
VAGQLRGIVGLELRISRIEAKAKLSQNRPAADIDGVVEGTRARGDAQMAQAVQEAGPVRP